MDEEWLTDLLLRTPPQKNWCPIPSRVPWQLTVHDQFRFETQHLLLFVLKQNHKNQLITFQRMGFSPWRIKIGSFTSTTLATNLEYAIFWSRRNLKKATEWTNTWITFRYFENFHILEGRTFILFYSGRRKGQTANRTMVRYISVTLL